MTERKSDTAASCFAEGFSCSQAVFSAFAPQLGLDRETALRVASAFGAGIAGRGETCGAVTGAFMAIGLKYGKTRGDDQAAREETYRLCAQFVRSFEERHGSIVCKALLGYNLSDPQSYQAARQAGVFNSTCPVLVKDAAEILAEIL